MLENEKESRIATSDSQLVLGKTLSLILPESSSEISLGEKKEKNSTRDHSESAAIKRQQHRLSKVGKHRSTLS